MSFFTPPPPPPPPQRERQPEWLGPPDGLLPGLVGLAPIIVRSERAAIALLGFSAYPTGLSFQAALRLREEPEENLADVLFHGAVTRDGRLLDEVLRLGVQLADGRKATNVGRRPLPTGDELPEAPLLMEGAGGGGGRRYDLSYWLWPLPPPGTLTFVVEWPAFDVAQTRAEVDAGRVLEAAGRVVRLSEPA